MAHKVPQRRSINPRLNGIRQTQKSPQLSCGLSRYYRRIYLVSPVTYLVELGESEQIH